MDIARRVSYEDSIVMDAFRKFELSLQADPTFAPCYIEYAYAANEVAKLKDDAMLHARVDEIYTRGVDNVAYHLQLLTKWGTTLWLNAVAKNYDPALVTAALEKFERIIWTYPNAQAGQYFSVKPLSSLPFIPSDIANELTRLFQNSKPLLILLIARSHCSSGDRHLCFYLVAGRCQICCGWL